MCAAKAIKVILSHCVKRVRIRSYSVPHFSSIFPHSDWIRRDTECLSVFSPNAGKMRTRITPNTDTFYAVSIFGEPLIFDKAFPGHFAEEWTNYIHNINMSAERTCSFILIRTTTEFLVGIFPIDFLKTLYEIWTLGLSPLT